MSSVADLLDAIAALAGQNWLFAVAAAFVVMICESAKPRPVEGEERHTSALERVAMIASLIVPVLLFLHVFGAFAQGRMSVGESSEGNNRVVIGLFVIAAIYVIVPGLIGWLIAKASPAFANLLHRAAPFLALAVFAFTVYVTYRNAFFVLNLYVLSHMR